MIVLILMIIIIIIIVKKGLPVPEGLPGAGRRVTAQGLV